jgi:hypothetical protein
MTHRELGKRLIEDVVRPYREEIAQLRATLAVKEKVQRDVEDECAQLAREVDALTGVVEERDALREALQACLDGGVFKHPQIAERARILLAGKGESNED